MLGQNGEAEQAGKDDDERHAHLESGADDGSHFGTAQIAGREHALDDEKVRGPVTKRDDEAEAEDDAGPMNAHGIVGEMAETLPEVRVVLAGEIFMDARDHAAPAAGFLETDDGDQNRTEPDQEELQNFVEDGR